MFHLLKEIISLFLAPLVYLLGRLQPKLILARLLLLESSRKLLLIRKISKWAVCPSLLHMTTELLSTMFFLGRLLLLFRPPISSIPSSLPLSPPKQSEIPSRQLILKL